MKQAVQNLNKLRVANLDGGERPLADPAASSGPVRCYFRDIEEHFLSELTEPGVDAVVGCVAWLTSKRILAALAKKLFVSCVVQKEDFLRPDALSSAELRKAYQQLQNEIERPELPGLVGQLGLCDYPDVAAVRCVGNHNAAKQPSHPRMHHKFAVFCEVRGWSGRSRELQSVELIPRKVWTGSFNFTQNGVQSLENAVVVSDSRIAEAYFREWEQIFALSEPLDWKTSWVAPEYGIGS